MELQSRFRRDERFRMDSRFLEDDEDKEEEKGEAAYADTLVKDLFIISFTKLTLWPKILTNTKLTTVNQINRKYCI